MTHAPTPLGVIVSPQPIFRFGIKELLILAGIQLAHEAASADSGLHALRRVQPQVLVLDMKTPERPGDKEQHLDVSWIRKFHEGCPAAALLCLTDIDRYGLTAFEHGATAYLKKDCQLQEFHDALFAAVRGQPYIGHGASQALIARACATDRPATPFARLPASLKPVLNDILSGCTPGEIAAKRHLSPGTISRQRKQIRELLGVRTDVDVLRLAVEQGYQQLG